LIIKLLVDDQANAIETLTE